MAAEPLQNLTEQSARVGMWVLSVASDPLKEVYSFSKGNGKGKGNGMKFECLLVSDNSDEYCLGQFRRKGKEPAATREFDEAIKKINKGTVWKVNKISLAKKDKKYLGCSHKVVIDMNASNFQPVLQNTVKMPELATPPENLNTLLQCSPGQLVDVTAFVTHVSEKQQAQTYLGMRDVVNVTIMDDSGDTGAAKSEFAAWFPKISSGEPCDDLKRLYAMVEPPVPVSFFNLVCQTDEGKTILKPSINSFAFETVRIGPKAERLLAKADALLATNASNVTVVAELPNFQPREKVDYPSPEATLTVCRLLHLARQGNSETHAASSADAAEHTPVLFQINHARILEPKGLDSVFASNTNRLWPNLRVIDSTGTVEIRMREKTALILSGAPDAETFAELVEKGALNFPILCSIRITMRKSTRSEFEGDYMDTCIVEAVEQDLLCPRSLPNSSVNYLTELLHAAAPDPSRMIAAPISSVQHVSHVGMVVNSVPVSCVLSLIAHVGRSETHNLDGGHKLISKGCWNVPFKMPLVSTEGAPEHADTKINGEAASYCTMENVQDYTLSARRPNAPMYALIVISSARNAPEGDNAHIYMVEKVAPVSPADVITIRLVLERLSEFAKTASQSTALCTSPVKWPEGRSPGSAKKSRRLGYHPTTASPPRDADRDD